jgi:hypothetical protein
MPEARLLMPTYSNGYIPENLLVIFKRGWSKIDGDWYWGLPAATYARHLALVALARKRNPDVWLTPTEGFSCYRPYWAQVIAQKVWGKGAATPGTSSHGGFWEGRQTLAIDYHNWGQVYGWNQAAWFADVRAVGLTPGMIMRSRGYPDEPWHVIDLDPWGAVPAFAGVFTPFVGTQPIIEEEADMPLYIRNTARGDYAVQPGVVKHIANQNVLNILMAANPAAVKRVDVTDGNLDAVLGGIGGITPAEIAALPADGLWVSGQITSNPTLDYGTSRPTQEVVLRSIDAKVDTLLGEDAAAEVEARLRDEFGAIPGAVRDEFKNRPLS